MSNFVKHYMMYNYLFIDLNRSSKSGCSKCFEKLKYMMLSNLSNLFEVYLNKLNIRCYNMNYFETKIKLNYMSNNLF